jgi:hypothetical protein
MKIFDKFLIIIITGSIWGLAELYGWNLLKAVRASNPATYLFVVSFVILFSFKYLLRFPGALIMVSVVTVLYKTLGVQFFKCQTTAVVIIAAMLDIGYHLFREKRYEEWKWRSLAAVVMTFLSFILFGIYREYIYAAPGHEFKGFQGAIGYLVNSGIPAIILSVFIVHPAWMLGKYLKSNFGKVLAKPLQPWFYGAGSLLVLFIWLLLFFY